MSSVWKREGKHVRQRLRGRLSLALKPWHLSDDMHKYRERVVTLVAGVAIAVGMIALGETIFANSWLYGLIAFSIAVLAFLVGSVAMQWPHSNRPAAATNTQLQQSPPAIIESVELTPGKDK